MLSVIIGFTEIALEKAAADDSLQEDLNEVMNAARRSTDITRQLLAFARQQTIAPKVLELNETVEEMLKMLHRLIGEDIDLSWQPGPGRMPVFMGPSQLDQILANLCVNARDAIGGVGKVTIETDCVHFDAEYCSDHAGFHPGDFILLAISDDGCGMEKDALDKVFDPFFTTKGVGEGTGLGLSTVFGIVKQNDGFINVYSEPGKGTTFKIYLPPYAGKDLKIKAKEMTELPSGHGETVMIVEDETSILKLAQRLLAGLGYNVLAASTPGEAVTLAEEHAGEIHLLFTDVVMPEMNGRELSEQLHTLYPNLKTLFMSGYTAKVIAHRGVLEDGVSFISKPFSKNDIAFKVRQVLDKAKTETHD
ncbi:MAG: ATP-binding protein [Desulfobacterales bacterium]|nr:ATP-binding protein [Desulfobacterales bacterium]